MPPPSISEAELNIISKYTAVASGAFAKPVSRLGGADSSATKTLIGDYCQREMLESVRVSV